MSRSSLTTDRRFVLMAGGTWVMMQPMPVQAQFGGIGNLLGSVLGSLNDLIGQLNEVLGIAADIGIEFADAAVLIEGFERLRDILSRAEGLGWEVSRILDRFDEIFELAEAHNWFAAMQRSRDAYHQIRRAARTAVQISTQIQSDLQTRALYAGALTSLNKEPTIASTAAPMINNEWNSLIFERLGHVTSLLGVTQRLIVSEQAAIASSKERSQLQREAFLGRVMDQPLPRITTDPTFGLQFP